MLILQFESIHCMFAIVCQFMYEIWIYIDLSDYKWTCLMSFLSNAERKNPIKSTKKNISKIKFTDWNLSISFHWHDVWQFNKLILVHKFCIVLSTIARPLSSEFLPFPLCPLCCPRCNQINLKMFHSAKKRDSLHLMTECDVKED